MELDLVAVDSERVGGGLERHGLALGPTPHFGGIACWRYRSNAIQRLHLGVIGIIAEIFRIEGRGSLGHLGANIAELEPIGRLRVEIARRRGKACETFLAIEAPGIAVLGPA